MLLKERLAKFASAIFAIFMLGIIVACAAATGISILRNGLGADSAAWVQATGSIAAIAGAVWLSSVESFRQRRYRRREREEVAWGVRFAIVLARNEAGEIANEIIDGKFSISIDSIRYWRQRCTNARYLLNNFATRSDHIHPAIVQEAGNAILLMEEMEADVEAISECIREKKEPGRQLIESICMYHVHFSSLLSRIDERMNGVREALDRGEDMLPLNELWRE
ncbi:hypothetical protein [Azospirillum sp. TSO22-1]|uniref:hypothetical protein n=1 Tax=Azospirillum sp. TSO22-1 TaxID=716789 RepID=UPI0011B4676D|nr:hypothetical protein [Azospirillum sp. TSO22-1]